MSELISVVVTVYNKEKYVRRCLQSILDQTYAHLEIICVDDGSTDNSAEIIKELAQEDDRIRYLYKENGGVVSCWKFGLARCNGKYVTMVDSDDWLLENALSDMVEKAEEYYRLVKEEKADTPDALKVKKELDEIERRPGLCGTS